MNFADMIFHHALTRPQKPAVILADRVATYAMMAQGILSVMDRLRALHLAPESLVSVAIDSPIRHLIAVAALTRLGHPVVGVARTAELSALTLPVALYLEGSRQSLIPGLNQALVEDDWFAAPARVFDATPSRGFSSAESVCLVSLSSGTTGRPKAISHSVRTFDDNVRNYHFSIGAAGWDRMLCLPGLPSNWGITMAAHTLYAGKTLCFADSALNALHKIAVYRADCLAGSPLHLQEMLVQQRESPVPCPSLRVIFTGGSFTSRALLTEARASLCSNILLQYGSTEAGATAFGTVDQLIGSEGATGFLAPWAEVQVVDAEDRILPAGTAGILRTRAVCLGKPYPEGQDSSESGFRDGWFYPGDLGRLTEAGMLIVTGRRSEIINAGGTKLAPELIEDVVRLHPGIVEAAALAGRSANGVEEVWVAIVARAPVAAADLIRFCAGRNTPVDRVVTVAGIPRNSNGKAEREKLRPLFGN